MSRKKISQLCVTSLTIAAALMRVEIHAAEINAGTRLPVLEVPRAVSTPRVDGSADDPAWQKAANISALTLSLGEGGRGLQPLPTQVKLQWDEKYLYARFVCEDSEVYAPFSGRDANHYQGDVAEVFLDVMGDARHIIELQVNPNNDIFDLRYFLTTEARSDENLMLRPEVTAHDWWKDVPWNMDDLRTATGRFD